MAEMCNSIWQMRKKQFFIAIILFKKGMFRTLILLINTDLFAEKELLKRKK